MAEKELLVYAAGGVAPPLQEVCAEFARTAGIRCRHINGKGHDLIAIMKESGQGDLASFGAEVMADFLEVEGLVSHDQRYHIGIRNPVILVPRGNPHGIRSIADLAGKDVRVGVAYDGCLIGIWESLLLKADMRLMDDFRRRIRCLSDGCGRLVRMLIEGEADAIIGWNSFQYFKEKAIEVIEIPSAEQVHRSTNVSLLSICKQPELAKACIDFIRSPRGKEIYQGHGWR